MPPRRRDAANHGAAVFGCARCRQVAARLLSGAAPTGFSLVTRASCSHAWHSWSSLLTRSPLSIDRTSARRRFATASFRRPVACSLPPARRSPRRRCQPCRHAAASRLRHADAARSLRHADSRRRYCRRRRHAIFAIISIFRQLRRDFASIRHCLFIAQLPLPLRFSSPLLAPDFRRHYAIIAAAAPRASMDVDCHYAITLNFRCHILPPADLMRHYAAIAFSPDDYCQLLTPFQRHADTRARCRFRY